MSDKLPTLKQAKTTALQLHSLLVREAGNGCAARGIIRGDCGPVMQCAHIIPKRKNTQVATDIANAWQLCAGHHVEVDSNPALWLRLVEQTVSTLLVRQMMAEVEEAWTKGVLWCEVDEAWHTPTKWWRCEAVRLWELCEIRGIEPTGTTQFMKRYCEGQAA